MYGSETMLGKEKERSRVRAVQMNNLKGLLGIRRMDKFPNSWIKELCVVTKRLMKVFSDVERMKNDRIKRVYVWECTGCCSVGRPRKRWIDIVKECLKKRGINVR